MGYTIRVEGLEEIRAALKQAEETGLLKALAQANKTGAAVVAKAAQSLAPHRSGKLAGSVRALGSQRSGRVRAGGAGVPYAGAIHWGRKVGNVGRPPGNHKGPNPIAGRPFLTEALAASQGEVVTEYEKAIHDFVVAPLHGG